MPGVWADPEPTTRFRHPGTVPPSWGHVIGNTVRLWVGRRFRRGRGKRFSAGTWRIVVLVLVIVAALGVALSLPRDQGKDTGAPGQRNAALSTPAAVREQAAGWIVQQASRSAIVGCDPAMCSALQARGFPVGNLLVISPGTADPLGSDLVAATSVLRSQFGSRLTSVYAPVAAASFGSGSAGIQIRVIASQGAAAYLTQLSGDFAARKSDGSQLLRKPGLSVAGPARAQLVGGQVDDRMLDTIAAITQFHPLRIVSFGDASPGASAGIPLRSVVLLGGASSQSANDGILTWVRAFLTAQQPPYVPASTTTVRLPSGQRALSIQYGAPAPLGLLGAGHSLNKIPSG